MSEDEDEPYQIYRLLSNRDGNGHHDATYTSDLSNPMAVSPRKPMCNAKPGTFGDMIRSIGAASN